MWWRSAAPKTPRVTEWNGRRCPRWIPFKVVHSKQLFHFKCDLFWSYNPGRHQKAVKLPKVVNMGTRRKIRLVVTLTLLLWTVRLCYACRISYLYSTYKGQYSYKKWCGGDMVAKIWQNVSGHITSNLWSPNFRELGGVQNPQNWPLL